MKDSLSNSLSMEDLEISNFPLNLSVSLDSMAFNKACSIELITFALRLCEVNL